MTTILATLRSPSRGNQNHVVASQNWHSNDNNNDDGNNGDNDNDDGNNDDNDNDDGGSSAYDGMGNEKNAKKKT